MAPLIRTFDQADAYIAKGRNKTSRRVTSTRHVARVDDDTIALVLHTTAVVTYHRDGTYTIYGGGWNTVTTKRTIADYSPVRISSHEGKWIVGYTGDKTPARVQKCRTCKGIGEWDEATHCWGPSTWMKETVCRHGETARHETGTAHRSCYRCDGTGRTDYGSNPIPVTVYSDQAYRVDASGAFIGTISATPYAPGHYATSSKPAVSKPAESHTYGAGLVDDLSRVLPNVRADVTHPINSLRLRLDLVIVSLNDTYRWSREQIADWLDTLDLDLRFPA